jgi:hypothetical protein
MKSAVAAEPAHGDDRPPLHTRFGENGGLSSGGESRPTVMVGCSRPLRARDRWFLTRLVMTGRLCTQDSVRMAACHLVGSHGPP